LKFLTDIGIALGFLLNTLQKKQIQTL